MRNLIIPMGGKSSRFPEMRPKWMLTHPSSGSFMCIESIKGINLDFFDNVFFVILKEHDEKYQAKKGILSALESLDNYQEIYDRTEVITLDSETNSQSETVYNAILKNNIEGFIYIKDSDGFFEFNVESEDNQVTYMDLNNIDEINARSKSYIEIDSNGIITNMVEKKVISSKFCVGGYGFNSASEFCEYNSKIEKNPGECYISNVVFQMILDGRIFIGNESFGFKDWGTIKSWNDYKENIYTAFVDLDGTLVKNTSHLIPPFIGEGEPLLNNIASIRRIKNNGGFIVITTGRPEKYRSVTIEELERHQIPYDILLMGLPHSRRLLINDFAKSNPYPSCFAINLHRNSDDLDQYLK